MKAIVYTQYGSPDVLTLEEVEKPTPKDNEILLQVRAASVNPLDFHAMRGKPVIGRLMTGLRQPKNTRLGADVAGQVVAVGKDVTEFQIGDEVFGVSRGTFAEYICTLGKAWALKPSNLSFEQAATVPVAAFTALQGLRDKGRLQAGQRVLINGAAGGVGTFAVQLAKVLGAEVTAVCSTRNLAMVKSIGADQVIDYTQEDFTRRGEQYDLILDNVGNHSLSAYRRIMNPNGVYVLVGGPLGLVFKVMALSRLNKQKWSFFIAASNREDLIVLKELIEAQKVRPVIDRCYSLAEVPDAVHYLGQGHARGKVVILM
jgi:NADPH:quinone reductase-like Zn-dependent oxidoreductase